VVGSHSCIVTVFTQPAKVSGLKKIQQTAIIVAPMLQAMRLGASGFQTGGLFAASRLAIQTVGESRVVAGNIATIISKNA